MVFNLFLCVALSITSTIAFSPVSSFRSASSLKSVPTYNGARSMTAIMDVFASIALAAQLNSGNMNVGPKFMSQSMPLSVVETKQGMYKEYTIDKVDDSALDEIRRGYKTAEETEDGKTKYWAIFAVLVAGSFIIPMAQYYWYVAEED